MPRVPSPIVFDKIVPPLSDYPSPLSLFQLASWLPLPHFKPQHSCLCSTPPLSLWPVYPMKAVSDLSHVSCHFPPKCKHSETRDHGLCVCVCVCSFYYHYYYYAVQRIGLGFTIYDLKMHIEIKMSKKCFINCAKHVIQFTHLILIYPTH